MVVRPEDVARVIQKSYANRSGAPIGIIPLASGFDDVLLQALRIAKGQGVWILAEQV